MIALCQAESMFDGYCSLLAELEKEVNSNQTDKLELLLNILKMQLFSLVGILDPAEKQLIKKNLAELDLKKVEDRLEVMTTFRETIGAVHPHTELLAARQALLQNEIKKRSVLTAIRSDEENFYSLLNELKHFSQTVGKTSNIMIMFSDNTCHQELTTWISSAVSFIKSIQNYSTFPDIVVPVSEAVCR